MSKLRIERYVSILHPSEREAIQQHLKHEERGRLRVLWELTSRYVTEGESLRQHKKEVFAALFGRPYSQEEDYLLRNEYRLLVELIEHILAERYALERCRTNFLFHSELLLEVLMERGLWPEFDHVFSAAVARAQELHDYHLQLRLVRQQITADTRRQMFSQEHLLEIIKHVDSAIRLLHELTITEYERLAALRASIEHTLDAEQVTYPALPPLDLERTATPLQHYYKLKREALRYHGSARLSAAEQCTALLRELNPQPGTPLFGEYISALGTLGVLYMIEGSQYTRSAEATAHAIELAHQHTDGSILLPLVYNYCSALLKAGNYHAALKAFEQYPAMLEDPRISFRAALLKAYAQIFVGQSQEIVLPAALRSYPISEYHYAWYLFAIVAFVRGNYDDALRESMNLHKHFVRQRLQKVLPTEYMVVGLFRAFFQAVLSSRSTYRLAARKRIASALNLIAEQNPFYRDYLPILWLRQQLPLLEQ